MEQDKNSTSQSLIPSPKLKKNNEDKKKVTFNITISPSDKCDFKPNFYDKKNKDINRYWCVTPLIDNYGLKINLDPNASKLLKRRREKQKERAKMNFKNN